MNQPERRQTGLIMRFLVFLAGLVLAFLSWLAVYNGRAMLPGKPFSLESDVERDPITFWCTFGVYVLLAGYCFYFALKGIGSALRAPQQTARWLLNSRVLGYRKLSLPARLGVALVCFEGYCRAKSLRHPIIEAFILHMWDIPCITSLPDWESQDCELVQVGLGDPFPPEIQQLLKAAGIEETDFRRLVESCVEIIYGSAYAASDYLGSLRFLHEVLCVTSTAGVGPPPVEPFLVSLFADGHGWGKRLSAEQRDAWRLGAQAGPTRSAELNRAV